MFTITKILSLLVYPLSLGVLVLALSIAAASVGRRGVSWLLAIGAFGLLYFPSTEFGANALMEGLEGRHPAFSPEELPNADAIVLLGGATDGESRFGRGADYNHAADRLLVAAELYFAGKAPVILVSGGSLPPERPEAEVMADTLKALRVPENALLLETASSTTADNAVLSAELLARAGHRHILLVTSGAHMRRALALFQAQNLQVTAVATDHQIPRYPSVVPGWLPQADHMARSTRAIHEWVGYWVYDISGKL